MAQTVISGATPFCTLQQMIDRHDWNTVADLLTDKQGVEPNATITKLTKTEVLASTVLTAFLMEYSGLFESAILKGGRNTVADLAALSGTNAGEMVAGMISNMVMWRLYNRRPDRKAEMPTSCEVAIKWLDELNEGHIILGFQETADAGRLSNNYVHVSPTVHAARSYFGSNAERHHWRHHEDDCDW